MHRPHRGEVSAQIYLFEGAQLRANRQLRELRGVLRAVDKAKAEDRRVLFGARGGVPSDGLLQGGKVRLRDFRTAKTRG
jgi:hypothetical protein